MPTDWAVGEGGGTRHAGGKVATWKKYNSNLKIDWRYEEMQKVMQNMKSEELDDKTLFLKPFSAWLVATEQTNNQGWP